MKTKIVLISLLKVYLIPFIGLLLITLLYTGCDEEESTGTTPPPENPNEVLMQGSVFNPSNLIRSVGTTVTWRNNDNTPHTVTGSSFNSGTIAPNGVFPHTFNDIGQFDYGCSIHAGMNGRVTVQ